jgi:hypothetical protein
MMTQDPSGTATTGTAGNSPVADEGGLPANWIEAIPALVASRIGIFQIEAKDALEATVRKLIISGVLVFRGLFTRWNPSAHRNLHPTCRQTFK